MTNEFNALITNVTQILVPTSHAVDIVSCKWVFRTKHFANGNIECQKTRLVAKECLQQSGIDYEETFSPVVKATIIRLILALSVTNGWPIHQYDVQNAFLHRPLIETIFMAQPPGFAHPQFSINFGKPFMA